METFVLFFIGIIFLAIGFPIGDYLAKSTREELRKGRKWFRMIIWVSVLGALMSLIFRIDSLLFTFLFIIIVTSRSLKR